MASFRYFHKHYCTDISLQNPSFASAALAGFMQGKTPLPSELSGFVQRQLEKKGREVLPFFSKNWTNPKPTRYGLDNVVPSSPDASTKMTSIRIDTWLIEVWPLVLEESWLYPDLLQLAEIKGSALINFLGSEEQVRTRCKKLKLRLDRSGGPRVQARKVGGRPYPIASLASFIRSFGEHPLLWFRGQRGLAES